MIRRAIIVGPVAAFMLIFMQCGNDPDEYSVLNGYQKTTLIYAGPWISGWPELGHDGDPFESEHFIVYSNYSSDDVKAETSVIAQDIMNEIVSEFDVSWDDYDFVPLQSNKKIAIFSDQSQRTGRDGLAYRDGIIIRSLNSPRYFTDYSPFTWRRMFKHELTHVNEFLLIGNPYYQQANSVWFREGIANYISDNRSIITLSQLEAWRLKMKDIPGEGNPLKIRIWSDFPQSTVTTAEYYASFELTVRYLLDPKGNNSTLADVVAYYNDLGNGVNLNTAFANNFGIDYETFEANYWDLMSAYLNN